ncbi:MAG TPA: hypothetical protein VF399_08315 [bacterium]
MKGEKIKYIIFAAFIAALPLSGTILLRNTFEECEASGNFITNTKGNGFVNTEAEGADPYQAQSHGIASLHIKDADNHSSAGASKTFINKSLEYMIEFYMWIPGDYNAFDSFPLCCFKYFTYQGTIKQTDIALYLHESGGKLKFLLKDAKGFHLNVAGLRSTDCWYKIQIYRHNNIDDLYINGDLIGSYYPINPSKVSNTILLGASEAESSACGDIFYDDIIISTVPKGVHPRLLFNKSGLKTLRNKRGNETRSGLNISYADLWDTLQNSAADYNKSDNIRFPWPIDSTRQKDTVINYPYEQLPLHNADAFLDYWLNPMRQIINRLINVALVGLINNNKEYKVHVKKFLVSLANWTAFTDQTNRVGKNVRYAQLCTGEMLHGMALAYDWLFNDLSNYEKMSIQNTMITLGISQIHLQALYYPYAQENEPPLTYANGRAIMLGGGMGMACLALDDMASLRAELATARAKIDTLLKHSDALGGDGGFNEGLSYGLYAARHLISFLIADGTINNYMGSNMFLSNLPRWQIYSMLPGAEQYKADNTGSGPNCDVSFSDYDKYAGLWNPATCYIANHDNNEVYQWWVSRRKDMNKRKEFRFFLWADPKQRSASPDNFPDTYPLSECFASIGWLIARTGWNDDDYLLAFKSGPPEPNSHCHREQNSFIFGGKGRWLIADVGYARRSEQRERIYHNVLDDYETNPYALRQPDSMVWSYDAKQGITCFKSIDWSYNRLKPWQREIIFFNNLGSFAVYDYALRQSNIDSLHWRMHSWVAPNIVENSHKIMIAYPNGPNLLGYMVYPEEVSGSVQILTKDSYIENRNGRTLQRINVKLNPLADTVRVVTGFAVFDIEETANILPISAVNFKGAKLTNEKGDAVVLFGTRDNTPSGRYEVSVTDSLLNVVCNLVPNAKYDVVRKKGDNPEKSDTFTTNNLGLLSFKLKGKGKWKVSLDRRY